MNTFSMTLTMFNAEMIVDLKSDAGEIQMFITPSECRLHSVSDTGESKLVYTHRSSYRAVIDEMIEVHGCNFALFYAEYMRKYA